MLSKDDLSAITKIAKKEGGDLGCAIIIILLLLWGVITFIITSKVTSFQKELENRIKILESHQNEPAQKED